MILQPLKNPFEKATDSEKCEDSNELQVGKVTSQTCVEGAFRLNISPVGPDV